MTFEDVMKEIAEVNAGRSRVISQTPVQGHGNHQVETSNGWTFEIFNDGWGPDFDYFEFAVAPSGERFDSFETSHGVRCTCAAERFSFYRPEDLSLWGYADVL